MKRMLVLRLVIACLTAAPAVLQAGILSPIYNVDHPTAGLLEHGEYYCAGRIGPESSVLAGLGVGIKGIFQIGASFGVQKVFERGSLAANDKVGFQVKVRLLEEYQTPALAIGFDNQGRGFYHEDAERYDRKSPGFYAVLSKNYLTAAGEISLHGGANYSTESEDDGSPDFFAGADWRVISELSFLFDADAALNDNADGVMFGKGGIYIDGAVRVNYGGHLSFMLVFRDLTGNFKPAGGVGREFEISVWDSF
ncbi:MAG: hypothetical protein HY770_06435 [Chitinivibrionia bacterium]|nr:hypothetical protein [Chitinivibrionia bacterium]